MSILFIINDAPYGTEKAYNAFRPAMTIQKDGTETEVKIFLLADAVFCALPGQKTPDGYYNIERMLNAVIRKGGEVKACGGCAEARGIDGLDLVDGVQLSNMRELAGWSVECEKVISF